MAEHVEKLCPESLRLLHQRCATKGPIPRPRVKSQCRQIFDEQTVSAAASPMALVTPFLWASKIDC